MSKSWVENNKIALMGGLIGIVVCIMLFGFYYFVYDPWLFDKYGDSMPANALLLPTVTGHIFPALSHFVIEGLPVIQAVCPMTENVCIHWSAQSGCLESIMEPTASCSDRVEQVAAVFFSILLIIIYFIIGLLIGGFVEKRGR